MKPVNAYNWRRFKQLHCRPEKIRGRIVEDRAGDERGRLLAISQRCIKQSVLERPVSEIKGIHAALSV
jgi:hypothetical protein